MTVHAKPCGFRTHLGNRCAIPTFPPPRRLLDSFNTNQERSFPPPSPRASFRLILQLEKTKGPARDRQSVMLARLDFFRLVRVFFYRAVILGDQRSKTKTYVL